jgi:predicted flavoprotein YhiN
LLHIAWNGGGELPKALEGLFTSTLEAQRIIDAWAATTREVEVEDRTKETTEESLQKRGPGRPPNSPKPI